MKGGGEGEILFFFYFILGKVKDRRLCLYGFGVRVYIS